MRSRAANTNHAAGLPPAPPCAGEAVEHDPRAAASPDLQPVLPGSAR